MKLQNHLHKYKKTCINTYNLYNSCHLYYYYYVNYYIIYIIIYTNTSHLYNSFYSKFNPSLEITATF